MKSIHKNLNEKHHESNIFIETLKLENLLLTSKLNEMYNNVCDCFEKDNLINTMTGHLEKLQIEIRSLKLKTALLPLDFIA